MYKLFCDEYDGDKVVNTVEIVEREFIVDGYSFADRLLEGVDFIVKFNEEGNVINVSVADGDKDWFEKTFNSEEWYKTAAEYAESTIKVGDVVEVPKHIKEKYNVGEDCAYTKNDSVDEDEVVAKKAQPVAIGKAKLGFEL